MELHNFLNTNRMTSMGKGVGLGTGNSFLFYENPSSTLSYFPREGMKEKMFVDSIKSGDIDILHSYGKKVDFTREDAVRALREMNKYGLSVKVWIDHTKSIDNFGDDVTFGRGDHPGSREYHADLTVTSGVRFVWLGRLTMIAGQGASLGPGSFASIFVHQHPAWSLLNMGKEFCKNVLGLLGSAKYSMHGNNDLIRVKVLDDGQKVYEFIRFDNYWKGVGTGASNRGLADVLSRRTLESLKAAGGYVIVYTHLGMNDDCRSYICDETVEALRNLKSEYDNGAIFVSSTSKLLEYYVATRYLDWSFEEQGNEILIRIAGIDDPVGGRYVPLLKDLDRLTFYVPKARQVAVYLGNDKIIHITRNPVDASGRESITIEAGQGTGGTSR